MQKNLLVITIQTIRDLVHYSEKKKGRTTILLEIWWKSRHTKKFEICFDEIQIVTLECEVVHMLNENGIGRAQEQLTVAFYHWKSLSKFFCNCACHVVHLLSPSIYDKISQHFVIVMKWLEMYDKECIKNVKINSI